MLPQVRVQERMQCLAMGALPRSITVISTGELADRCKPGGQHLLTYAVHFVHYESLTA